MSFDFPAFYNCISTKLLFCNALSLSCFDDFIFIEDFTDNFLRFATFIHIRSITSDNVDFHLILMIFTIAYHFVAIVQIIRVKLYRMKCCIRKTVLENSTNFAHSHNHGFPWRTLYRNISTCFWFCFTCICHTRCSNGQYANCQYTC